MTTGIRPPSKIRLMSHLEYHIVSGVFANTLPYRFRIFITNAAGAEGRAFTIPTALIASLVPGNPASFFASIPLGYASSAINVGYLINAGDDYDKLATTEQRLLVHETTHVWQGKNSAFALSYVFSSLLNQALYGSGAYAYTPGQPWDSYNAEQQASIVEDWFRGGMPASGALYPYITDHVRRGDA